MAQIAEYLLYTVFHRVTKFCIVTGYQSIMFLCGYRSAESGLHTADIRCAITELALLNNNISSKF